MKYRVAIFWHVESRLTSWRFKKKLWNNCLIKKEKEEEYKEDEDEDEEEDE